MAVTMIMELPAGLEDYNAINERMGVADDPPDGLIIHTGAVVGDKIRAVDVWESAEHFERFRDGRLNDAIAAVMGPPPDDAPAPEPEITELINVIRG